VPKAAPVIASFNSGEFSPLMMGRADIKYYSSACKRIRNFIPTPQGPARFRPGTRFVAEIKDSSERAWFWRFEFNVEQAYVLEFGDLYIRFFSNHGVVESSPGVPLEVVTPYAAADLTADDGTFNLRFVQSGDVLYVCHPDYPVYKLTRTGAAAFSFAAFAPYGGPFKDVDPDETITVYASADTGSVTLTASSIIFTSDHIGTNFYIERRKVNDIKQWEAGKSVTLSALRRSDGKTYKALNAATTGATRPTHSVGAEYDGDTGVQWEYQDAGYGWATITAIGGGGLTATATVVSRLPYGCVSSGQATTRWAFSAWSDIEGWPTNVTFFRERLVFCRGQELWFSVAGDFEDFSRKDDSGLVTDDMAIVSSISSDRSNRIEWMAPSDVALLVGTAGDEHAIMEITSSDPFGPSNSRALKQTEYGSKHVPEVRVGSGVLFVQKSGRKIRDMLLAESVNERWEAGDLTVLAEHSTRSGVVWMSYQQEPDSVVWVGLANGELKGFTLNREQDVRGWHPHTIGGTGVAVESGITIPAPDGDRDELWLIVRRTIDGVTKRYVEYVEKVHEDGDNQEDMFYVDSGLTYSGAPVASLSGLDHLEGETVAVLADGGAHPNCVVSAGAITLQRDASVVHVGLGYTGILTPMPIEAGAADGTSQTKTKRASHCSIRFDNTLGARYGRDENSQLDRIEFRSASDPMGAPPPLFTGIKTVSWPDGYEGDALITVVQDQPMACTVVCLVPHMVTQDSPGSRNR
jgi:hypothetical protein